MATSCRPLRSFLITAFPRVIGAAVASSLSRRSSALVCGLVLVLVAACSGGENDPPSSVARTAPPSVGTGSTSAPATPATAQQVGSPDEIYTAPDPVPSGPHGTLLRYQEVTPSVVPGARTWRVLYTSESLQGEPIVVTGTVLVPTAPAPAEGRVVLTLAHGTTGGADACAPSRNPQQSEVAGMVDAVRRGWLVTMSDYEGLGSPGRHPYLVGESEGRGVIDVVLASRAMPEARPGSRVAVAGYSQGGHGALWATQVAPRWAPDLTIVGTFAGAPATELDVILGAASSLPNPAFILLLVAGFNDSYPEADPAAVLSEQGVARLPVVDSGCVIDVFKALADAPPGSLVRAGAATAQPWAELAKRNNPGQVALASPVLLIHSTRDDTVPVQLSALLAARMCSIGQVVERRVLPDGGSHVDAVVPAFRDGLVWLTQRVEGVGQPTNDCAKA